MKKNRNNKNSGEHDEKKRGVRKIEIKRKKRNEIEKKIKKKNQEIGEAIRKKKQNNNIQQRNKRYKKIGEKIKIQDILSRDEESGGDGETI